MNQTFVKIADGDLYPITLGDFENTEVDCAAGVSSEPVFPLRSIGSIEFTVTTSIRSIQKLRRVAYGWNAKGPLRRKLLKRAWHQLNQARLEELGMPRTQIRRYIAAARFSLERQVTVKGRRS